MDELQKRTLGRTGLDVTILGYGAMELRGAPRGRPVDRQQAAAVLNAVLDGGINFIDTSPDYGISEELIGEAISHRRGEFFLASKCGCLVGAAPTPPGQRNPHVFTRENIIAGVNQSLARMKTEYLDLVQFHASPSRDVLEQHAALETLRDLQAEGKIRFIGISGTLPNLPEQIAMGVFDAFQIPYSALQREHEALISEAARAGGGTIIRGGVAKGIPSDGRQPGDPWQLWDKAGLDDLLDGMSRMEFILRYTLSHPDLHTTIVGTMSPEHLQENLAAARRGPLPPDVYEEAKRRLAAAGTATDGDQARA
jgi:aryl-alcohol dehydrogenase-like predicted oxidoreductase